MSKDQNEATTPSETFIRDSTQTTKEDEKQIKHWRSTLPSIRSYEENFENLCGFKFDELLSFKKFVRLLYRPTDAASLGVARALFGLCMVLDIVEERGFADIDIKWGDPWNCHFPLIHGMKVPHLSWMIVLYTVMWLGAFGIMLGLHFKLACACFAFPYWYIFLLDKSYWNNHTYLYGIVAILFWGTGANKYFALDANKSNKETETVPLWNYFVLKFQFFALYFLAGLKKSEKEWLDGYAMMNLSKHWVFAPFKMFLSTEQTDFFIVHWFAFIFDLTVGFWMLFDKTRIPAMMFCTAFHLMNSRLFSIGMFPYVCLATMPLFCHVDWPRKIKNWFAFNRNTLYTVEVQSAEKCTLQRSAKTYSEESKFNSSMDKANDTQNDNTLHEDENTNEGRNNENNNELMKEETKEGMDATHEEKSSTEFSKHFKQSDYRQRKVKKKEKFVVSLLLFHMALQFFLPYSHFITQGYNNWVPGLYGYSWDMMVHVWDAILVVIKVHDSENDIDHYLDSEAWVQNDRWTKHGDMARQYAFCLKDNLMRQKEEALINPRQIKGKEKWAKLSSNLSIHIDIWYSLNGRFQQRLFNPNIDMLTVDWHPLKPITYLMPLLTQYNSYRYELDEIQRRVYTWSNYTDVLFVADFPGLYLEHYISNDFSNVSLTVLEGEVTYKEENQTEEVTISKGRSLSVKTGKFHKIKTTSSYPACYMYIYTNHTMQKLKTTEKIEPPREISTISKELNYKLNAWARTFGHITNAFFNLVYNVPMVRRVRVNK